MSKEYKLLEAQIAKAYEGGLSLDESEKLAARFLRAQLMVSDELKATDLDARMRKATLKSLKSTVRLEEVGKHEKKPTEGALEDAVNTSKSVIEEQESLDLAEVNRDGLERYYNIFREAHIYFRGIAKGRFE